MEPQKMQNCQSNHKETEQIWRHKPPRVPTTLRGAAIKTECYWQESSMWLPGQHRVLKLSRTVTVNKLSPTKETSVPQGNASLSNKETSVPQGNASLSNKETSVPQGNASLSNQGDESTTGKRQSLQPRRRVYHREMPVSPASDAGNAGKLHVNHWS